MQVEYLFFSAFCACNHSSIVEKQLFSTSKDDSKLTGAVNWKKDH